MSKAQRRRIAAKSDPAALEAQAPADLGRRGGDAQLRSAPAALPSERRGKDGARHQGRKAIACKVEARLLKGNPNLIGKQGGFPGVKVAAGSAAIIPRQFTGEKYAGPQMRDIGRSAVGFVFGDEGSILPTQMFFGFTDTVGNAELSSDSIVAQDMIRENYPRKIILELVSGEDEGEKTAILILPATPHGCPDASKGN